jgi:hypothetical protein
MSHPHVSHIMSHGVEDSVGENAGSMGVLTRVENMERQAGGEEVHIVTF